MNKKDFSEIFKKAFGKEKDEKIHAIAMLIIYFIFISIVVIAIRVSPSDNNKSDNQVVSTPSPSVSPTSTPVSRPKATTSDINYKYSYTIIFDNNTEIYLGKVFDDKQKFSYTKAGETLEYAIKDDNYLISSNGVYSLTDKLDTYFKYCDADKILSLIEDKSNQSDYVYNITNSEIASIFEEEVSNTDLLNTVKLELVNEELKEIDLDFSNYISSILSGSHTLNIKMEFADIGKVEDFDIKMN